MKSEGFRIKLCGEVPDRSGLCRPGGRVYLAEFCDHCLNAEISATLALAGVRTAEIDRRSEFYDREKSQTDDPATAIVKMRHQLAVLRARDR